MIDDGREREVSVVRSTRGGRPRRTRSRPARTVLAAGAALVALGEAPGAPLPPLQAHPIPGETAEVRVESGRLVLRHVMSGLIAAERAVEFGAPDLGIHPLQIRWLADNGTRVAPGDRVVEFDNSTLVSQLEQLELSVDQAETGLETAVSAALGKVAEAEFEWLQMRVASKRAAIEADIPAGLKPELEYAKLQLALDQARLKEKTAASRVESTRAQAQAEIEIARIALEKARVALDVAVSKIERMVITAPTAGIVQLQQNWEQDRIFRTGDSAFPGMTIVRLPDPESLMVAADLYDVDDGAVVVGSPATLVLDAHPETTFTGVVAAVDGVAQQRSRFSLRRVFGVRIDLTSEVGVLRPGMSVRVVVEREVGCGDDRREPCLLVSRAALDLEEASRPRVVLATGEVREVALGACNSTTCVVTVGLAPGDRLAVGNGPGRR